MLKVLSISKRQLAKRVTCDYSMMYELFKTGIPVQAFAGHFMNWEYANISVVLNQPYPFLGIYMPVNSKALSRLLYRLRSRFGTILLKAGNVKADMEGWEGKQYVLGIAADQSPSNSMEAFWMEFMNQPSGFIKKPWLKIKTLEHAAVYMTMARTRRGYYHFTLQKMAEDIRLVTAEQLVLRYRDLLEKDINDYPDNYLWTHRRWKIRWKEDFQPLWIDTVPAPLSA
jgi:KDO2-lipid IV(A) lauroyltransferase